jgi:hypothetical protein
MLHGHYFIRWIKKSAGWEYEETWQCNGLHLCPLQSQACGCFVMIMQTRNDLSKQMIEVVLFSGNLLGFLHCGQHWNDVAKLHKI